MTIPSMLTASPGASGSTLAPEGGGVVALRLTGVWDAGSASGAPSGSSKETRRSADSGGALATGRLLVATLGAEDKEPSPYLFTGIRDPFGLGLREASVK